MPLVLLGLCLGVIGLRFGWQAAKITETDVINRYAAHYVDQTGGDLTDCAASPAVEMAGVWLIVRCASPDLGTSARYLVNRFGSLIAPIDMPKVPAAPQA